MEESQQIQKVKNLKLIEYASEGNLIHVEKLLQLECDVDVADKSGQTPLAAAIISQHKDVVELLLKNGADPNKTSFIGSSPLCIAATVGNKEIVEILLQYGARVNIKNKNGSTELHGAKYDFTEITKLLLEHGSDITIENRYQGTPVHTAIASGSLDTLIVMLPYINDINRKWFNNNTYLHYCSSLINSNNTNILEFLLKNGANPLIKNIHYNTPRQIAIKNLNDKYAPLLEKYEKIALEKKMLLCFAHELDEGSLLHKYFIGTGVFGMMMAYFG